jgi:hypothetical protein
MTPFEVFRTPILIRRFTQGFYLNGIWQEGSQVTLSGNLVLGNIIIVTINGVGIPPITFTTSHLVTMNLIKAAILSTIPNIQQVDLTNSNLTMTIIPVQPSLSFVNAFAISGVGHPTVTILNSPTIIPATASVQPLGKDVALVPEGRRDKSTFKMYTSTEIFGVTTQNPDQVTVLKAPFTGLVFVVININEWQNNSTFNIINHYK